MRVVRAGGSRLSHLVPETSNVTLCGLRLQDLHLPLSFVSPQDGPVHNTCAAEREALRL